MYTVFGFLNTSEHRDQIFCHGRTIHDYGCAEGDGTVLLRCLFPISQITGFDIWPGAIDLARERWTNCGLDFEVGDVSNPKDNCEILTALQTVDHVDDIVGTIERCREKSKVFVMAWAELPIRPDHPSQDRTWYDQTEKPLIEGVVRMRRYVPETHTVFADRAQIFAWVNE